MLKKNVMTAAFALMVSVALCTGCDMTVTPRSAGTSAPPTATPAPAAQAAGMPSAAPPTRAIPPGGDEAYAAREPEPLPWDDLPAPVGGFDFDTYPIVDGSTATRPLSQALAYHMTGITDMYELDLLASHTTTDEAYARLIDGRADLLLVYAPAQATQDMMEQSGVTLDMTAIGRDALVFLANEGNGVDSLTAAQIRAIYAGEITNWKDVGGRDLPIAAFQRPELSGSQTLMRALVMRGAAMADAPVEYRPQEMGDLVERVAGYRNEANAIGYSVYYYVSRMYMEEGVKLLKVDGVAPSAQSISDGSYPFVNDFYAVVRKDAPEGSPQRVMYDIMCGGEGGRMVEAMGYARPNTD